MSKLCEVCSDKEYKYQCPRCEQKTCSLECCRRHKELAECSGQRDKTKYVPKEEFDERSFLSDYRFLEEHARLIDAAARDPLLKRPHPHRNFHNDHHYPFIPTGFGQLRKFVYTKFGTKLRFMPIDSTRHAFNKSTFDRAKSQVNWSLEFVFHLSKEEQPIERRFNTKSSLFSSRDSLREILTKFYAKQKSELASINTKFGEIFPNQQYDKIQVLYQFFDFQQRKKYFIKFDMSKALEENLRNQSIVEYPTLYIVKTSDLGDFEIQQQPLYNTEPTKPSSQDKQQSGAPEDEDEHFYDDDIIQEGDSVQTLNPNVHQQEHEEEEDEEDDELEDEPPEEISNKKFKNDSNE